MTSRLPANPSLALIYKIVAGKQRLTPEEQAELIDSLTPPLTSDNEADNNALNLFNRLKSAMDYEIIQTLGKAYLPLEELYCGIPPTTLGKIETHIPESYPSAIICLALLSTCNRNKTKLIALDGLKKLLTEEKTNSATKLISLVTQQIAAIETGSDAILLDTTPTKYSINTQSANFVWETTLSPQGRLQQKKAGSSSNGKTVYYKEYYDYHDKTAPRQEHFMFTLLRKIYGDSIAPKSTIKVISLKPSFAVEGIDGVALKDAEGMRYFKESMASSDLKKQMRFLWSLFATLIIPTIFGEKDRHHNNLFINKFGIVAGIDYEDLCQQEGSTYDQDTLLKIIEQSPHTPQDRATKKKMWIKTDLLGESRLGGTKPNKEFIQIITAFFNNSANEKKLNLAKKKALSQFLTRIVIAVQQMTEHPIRYRRCAIHTAMSLYYAYEKWHGIHFPKQPLIQPFFTPFDEKTSTNITHPILALKNLDELLQNCSDEEAKKHLRPPQSFHSNDERITPLVEQLKKSSKKSLITRLAFLLNSTTDYLDYVYVLSCIQPLPQNLTTTPLKKQLTMLNTQFSLAQKAEKFRLLLHLGAHQIALLVAQKDPNKQLPAIGLEAYLFSRTGTEDWLTRMSITCAKIASNEKDHTKKNSYAFMSILLNLLAEDNNAPLSTILYYFKLITPLSPNKIQSVFYEEIMKQARRKRPSSLLQPTLNQIARLTKNQPTSLISKTLFLDVFARLPEKYQPIFKEAVNQPSDNWHKTFGAIKSNSPTGIKIIRPVVEQGFDSTYETFYLAPSILNLCFNENGTIKRGQYPGIRNVHRVKTEGCDIFIKDAPESPSNEQASKRWLSALTGENGYQQESVKCYSKQRKFHLLSITQTVPGETLNIEIKKHLHDKSLSAFYQRLDPQYWFYSMMANMTLPKEDAKENNYIVRHDDSRTRIVSIDQDHLCFGETVVAASDAERKRQTHPSNETIIAKNALFCLAGPMLTKIPPELMQAFLNRNPLALLETWALLLGTTHRKYKNFLSQKERKTYFALLRKNDGNNNQLFQLRKNDTLGKFGNQLDAMLPEGLLKNMFSRLMRIRRCFHLSLKNKKTIRYLDLLSEIDFPLAQHYKQAIKRYPHNPKQAFQWITNGFYDPPKKSLSKHHALSRLLLPEQRPLTTPAASMKLTCADYSRQGIVSSSKSQSPDALLNRINDIKKQQATLESFNLGNLIGGLGTNSDVSQIPAALKNAGKLNDYYIECLLGKINWLSVLRDSQERFCDEFWTGLENKKLALITEKQDILNLIQIVCSQFNTDNKIKTTLIESLINAEKKSTDLRAIREKQQILSQLFNKIVVKNLLHPQRILWEQCYQPIIKRTHPIHLEKLNLEHCKWLSWTRLTQLLKKISGLRYLNISDTPLEKLPNLGLLTPELRVLAANNMSNLVVASLKHSLLKTLSLNNCPQLTTFNLDEENRLKRLDISRCPQLKILQLIPTLDLKHIDIRHNTRLPIEQVAPLFLSSASNVDFFRYDRLRFTQQAIINACRRKRSNSFGNTQQSVLLLKFKETLETLFIDANALLNDSELDILLESIRGNRSFTTCKINGFKALSGQQDSENNIDPQSALIAIMHCLFTNAKQAAMKTLSFQGCDLSDEMLSIISHSIDSATKLHWITFNNCNISYQDDRTLSIQQQLRTRRFLNCINQQIPDNPASTIKQAYEKIKKNSGQTIDLENQGLGNQIIIGLLKVVTRKNTIKLQNNHLTPKIIPSLCAYFLRENAPRRSIYLAKNSQIIQTTIVNLLKTKKAFLQYIQKTTKRENLNRLSAALKAINDTALTSISFPCQHLDENFAKWLFAALQNNQSLRLIALDWRNLTNNIIEPLCDLLQKNTKIQAVWPFWGTKNIATENIERISRLLKRNQFWNAVRKTTKTNINTWDDVLSAIQKTKLDSFNLNKHTDLDDNFRQKIKNQLTINKFLNTVSRAIGQSDLTTLSGAFNAIKNSILTAISLKGAPLNDDDTIRLLTTLNHHPTLRIITLDWRILTNNITPPIERFLQDNPRIYAIGQIKCHNPGEYDFITINRLLAINRFVQQITLITNQQQITTLDDAFNAINTSKLTSLTLQKKVPLDNDTVIKLLAALRNNKTITELKLYSDKLTDVIYEPLNILAKTNERLERITINTGVLNKNQQKEITLSLKINRFLNGIRKKAQQTNTTTSSKNPIEPQSSFNQFLTAIRNITGKPYFSTFNEALTKIKHDKIKAPHLESIYLGLIIVKKLFVNLHGRTTIAGIKLQSNRLTLRFLPSVLQSLASNQNIRHINTQDNPVDVQEAQQHLEKKQTERTTHNNKYKLFQPGNALYHTYPTHVPSFHLSAQEILDQHRASARSSLS
jgi:hypothetical protein